jgi:hypothetical protein
MLNEICLLLAKGSNLTNAVATVASAIAAILAVLVSACALRVSHLTLKHQQQHNILSVRPIPIVTVLDREDSVRVKIRNHGSGPMLIQHVRVTNGVDGKESLMDWMPELPAGMLWTNFAGALSDRSLLPGSEIILLQLDGGHENETFAQGRDAVRTALAPLQVAVDYTDIYESTFKKYAKELTWFGRPKGVKNSD